MKRQYFGTDGVRGPFGGPVINASFAARLGFAATRWFHGCSTPGNGTPELLIGCDTRFSGPELVAALASGAAEGGCVPLSLGIVPTPAVSRAVRQRKNAFGAVVTASHNPASDNGIKFFGPNGVKLTDEAEFAIENHIPPANFSAAPAKLGVLHSVDEYREAMRALLPAASLRGWKIVLDTANGATCGTSPEVIRKLGADLVCLGCEPDGRNINLEVGSEHPEQLARLVLKEKAALGIAHDGDGDRCILCDENGQVLDGDEIMVILATHALRRNRLPGRTLVVTVQSNLGVEQAISQADGRVCRTQVGDRYVIERMLAEGAALGGESSGHIICTETSLSGDGLVAALKVLQVMQETGLPLSALRTALKKFPQGAQALKVREKIPLERLPGLCAEMAALEAELGSHGRLLVRYSGTEAKLRLLVEAPTEAVVAAGLARLEKAARKELAVL